MAGRELRHVFFLLNQNTLPRQEAQLQHRKESKVTSLLSSHLTATILRSFSTAESPAPLPLTLAPFQISTRIHLCVFFRTGQLI